MHNPKLEKIVSTAEAAKALNRAPQTLRKWACLENGPIHPLRINGRLAWRVSDLESLLNGHSPKRGSHSVTANEEAGHGN